MPSTIAHRAAVLALLVSAIALIAASMPSTGTAWAEGGTDDTEEVIAERLAQERAGEDLPSLERSHQLDAVAREWSRRQAADDEMRHNPDLGEQVQPATAWYENVGTLSGVPTGVSYAAAGDDLHELWMASDTDRANILRTPLTDVGIGVASVDDRIYATVVFRLADESDETEPSPSEPDDGPAPTEPSDGPASSEEDTVRSFSVPEPPGVDDGDPGREDEPPLAAAVPDPPSPSPSPSTGDEARSAGPRGDGPRPGGAERAEEEAPDGVAPDSGEADRVERVRPDDRPVALSITDEEPAAVPLALGVATLIGAFLVGASRSRRQAR